MCLSLGNEKLLEELHEDLIKVTKDSPISNSLRVIAASALLALGRYEKSLLLFHGKKCILPICIRVS